MPDRRGGTQDARRPHLLHYRLGILQGRKLLLERV